MAFGLGALAKTGIAAAPLFFGENNLFSGKAREASRELKNTFQKSQAYELPTQYKQYLQSKMTQANIGIPGAAMGLYTQEAGRGMNAQLGALRSRRSLLGGIGALNQGAMDSALKLAGMQANALKQARSEADQALMQYGNLQQREDMRKLDEQAQYWTTRKQESDQSISAALKGVGAAIGSAVNPLYGDGEKSIGELIKGLKKPK
jgi:hypothetical protein